MHVAREGPCLRPTLPVAGAFGPGREEQRHNKGHRRPWLGSLREPGTRGLRFSKVRLTSGVDPSRSDLRTAAPPPAPSRHHDSGQDSQKRYLPRAGKADQRPTGPCGSGSLGGQLLPLQNGVRGTRAALLCAGSPSPRGRTPLPAGHGHSLSLSQPPPHLPRLQFCLFRPPSLSFLPHPSQPAQALLTSVLLSQPPTCPLCSAPTWKTGAFLRGRPGAVPWPKPSRHCLQAKSELQGMVHKAPRARPGFISSPVHTPSCSGRPAHLALSPAGPLHTRGPPPGAPSLFLSLLCLLIPLTLAGLGCGVPFRIFPPLAPVGPSSMLHCPMCFCLLGADHEGQSQAGLGALEDRGGV